MKAEYANINVNNIMQQLLKKESKPFVNDYENGVQGLNQGDEMLEKAGYICEKIRDLAQIKTFVTSFD